MKEQNLYLESQTTCNDITVFTKLPCFSLKLISDRIVCQIVSKVFITIVFTMTNV